MRKPGEHPCDASGNTSHTPPRRLHPTPSPPLPVREELLEKVRAERAARGQVKQQEKAAKTIQRVFRGHRARQLTAAQLTSSWLESYAKAAAQADAQLSAKEVAGEAAAVEG